MIICPKVSTVILLFIFVGSECFSCRRRELDQKIDNDSDSDEGVKRWTRGVSKIKRPLKLHDANQVAKYFLNGGPVLGASHFTNAQCDTTDTSINSEDNSNENIIGISNAKRDSVQSQANPNKKKSSPIQSKANLIESKLNLMKKKKPQNQLPPAYTPLLGSAHRTPVYVPSHKIPIVMPVHSPDKGTVENHIVGAINPSFIRPISNSRARTAGLLSSLIHPQHLAGISDGLLKLVNVPAQTFMNMVNSFPTFSSGRSSPSFRNSGSGIIGSDILGSPLSTDVSRNGDNSTKMNEESDIVGAPLVLSTSEQRNGNPFTYSFQHNPILNMLLPQPPGYVLQLVPHDTQNQPTNPIVGLSQKPNTDTKTEQGLSTTNDTDSCEDSNEETA